MTCRHGFPQESFDFVGLNDASCQPMERTDTPLFRDEAAFKPDVWTEISYEY